jgi:hypothetical protein
MSAVAGYLPWAATRQAAAVLRAARKASGKHQWQVGNEIGWSQGKVNYAERALSRMTAADALAFGAAVGVTGAELGLEATA